MLMGLHQGGSVVPLTPLGDACLRMDLTAVHEILENLAYKDDEGAATEVCFWFDLLISKSTDLQFTVLLLWIAAFVPCVD